MNKDSLIGFALIVLVLIIYSIYAQHNGEDVQNVSETTNTEDVSLQSSIETQTNDALDENEEALQSTLFSSEEKSEQEVVLKNTKVEIAFSTRGAMPIRARILGFKSRDGASDVTLFDKNEQSLSFLLSGKSTNIATSQLLFSPSSLTDTTATFTATTQSGGSFVIQYWLGKDYLLHMSFKAIDLEGIFSPTCRQLDIVWEELCRQQEKGFTFENRYASLTYKDEEGGTDYLSLTAEKKDKKIDYRLDWVAYKSQFFSVVLIACDGFDQGSSLTSVPQDKGSGYLKYYRSEAKTSFDPSGQHPTKLEMYFGPNDFRLLQAVEKQSEFGKDLKLQRLVYLGWPLFRIINRWFTLYVFDFLTSLGLNMGIVLILITLLLKVITFPMVKKSYMSSAKMRVLKPKVEEATKQYNKPEDQMQRQQAMMQLYAKYGVSPLSGCLPMLIQMPIWIAMFNFVPNAIQLRGESFLWIKDLSTYDPIVEWNANIWMIGDHLSLTCILFCVSNVLYSIMSMRQQKDQMVGQQAEQMKMMRWMMYLMPVFFFFMFNDYSSGLNFYYFISLFFSAAVMWTLRKTTDDKKLLSKLEARYKENQSNPKKVQGLSARLEAMQKRAAEIQQEQMKARQKKQ